MKIHYFQHVPFEGPSGIRLWADQYGHKLAGTRFFKNEPLPDIEKTDALVIMGGPMSVHDENRYPWLQREKAFIRECITQEKKVLGICLGAQLIADVLGAKVVPMMQKEIGWFPLCWTMRPLTIQCLMRCPGSKQFCTGMATVLTSPMEPATWQPARPAIRKHSFIKITYWVFSSTWR